MGALLLVSDDLGRAERLARELGAARSIQVHDLYAEGFPLVQPELIVSDVAQFSSDAILRLRRLLEHVRGDGVPLLILVHGNAVRAEAHAQVLDASGTLPAAAAMSLLRGRITRLQREAGSVPASATKLASEARQFFIQTFFSGHPVTPELVTTGTELITRAVQDSGIRDWVGAVQRFDDVTHQHCLLVAGLAASFSGILGLAPGDRHRLAKAALLHDVGKTKIPTAILNKPGKLDEAELAVMRTHPAEGYTMLASGGFDVSVLAVVRSHHEMLDGSGYPDKLKGAEISDLVRLVTICDIHAALIERRPYKAPLDPAKAYAILEGMTGRLDGDLVRAFRPVTRAFHAAEAADGHLSRSNEDAAGVAPVRLQAPRAP